MTTLFGIDITDCASRLIAADAAEERGLGELATALRDAARPLLLEPGESYPALLPKKTYWSLSGQATRLRRASGLLADLARRAGYDQFALVVFLDLNARGVIYGERSFTFVQRVWNLDRFVCGADFTAAALPDGVLAAPGVVIVWEPIRRSDQRPLLHVHPADAHRFGFLHIPAFAE